MFLEFFRYLAVYIKIVVVGQDIGSVPISLGSGGETGMSTLTQHCWMCYTRKGNVNVLDLISHIVGISQERICSKDLW